MDIRISAVIPLYNKRETIRRALDSILNQVLLPMEIIVVDDGSTDDSAEVVAQIRHPLVRLVSQPNRGVSAARNKGIEEAAGEWIAFLDADDEWMPGYLETIRNLSVAYPQCDVLATSYFMQDSSGNDKPITLRGINFKNEHGILPNYFEVAAGSNPPVWSSAVVIKKISLQQINGFPVGIKSGEDLLTWARLAVRYQIAYHRLPRAIFFVDRSHEISRAPTRMYDAEDFVGDGLLSLLREYPETRSLKRYISHWYKMRASVYLRVNDRRNLLKYCIKSLRYNVANTKVYLFLVSVLLPEKLNYLIRKAYTG